MEDNKDYKNNLEEKRLEITIDEDCKGVQIEDKAPIFNANTTFGPIKLTDYIGKWVILFSHPR